MNKNIIKILVDFNVNSCYRASRISDQERIGFVRNSIESLLSSGDNDNLDYFIYCIDPEVVTSIIIQTIIESTVNYWSTTKMSMLERSIEYLKDEEWKMNNSDSVIYDNKLHMYIASYKNKRITWTDYLGLACTFNDDEVTQVKLKFGFDRMTKIKTSAKIVLFLNTGFNYFDPKSAYIGKIRDEVFSKDFLRAGDLIDAATAYNDENKYTIADFLELYKRICESKLDESTMHGFCTEAKDQEIPNSLLVTAISYNF